MADNELTPKLEYRDYNFESRPGNLIGHHMMSSYSWAIGIIFHKNYHCSTMVAVAIFPFSHFFSKGILNAHTIIISLS